MRTHEMNQGNTTSKEHLKEDTNYMLYIILNSLILSLNQHITPKTLFSFSCAVIHASVVYHARQSTQKFMETGLLLIYVVKALHIFKDH